MRWASARRHLIATMFELHQFFPLLEPAYLADPNKTAEVIGVLMQHAGNKKMMATVSMLEHALMQLANGESLAVVGRHTPANELVDRFGPPPPAPPVPPLPPPAPPPAPSSGRGARKRRKRG